MEIADKAALLQAAFAVEHVEVPGKGAVKVRALTRGEALKLHGVELDADELERKLLAQALLEPRLTEAEIGVWQDNSAAGELQAVVEAVIRLSGMEQHALKAAVRQFREGT